MEDLIGTTVTSEVGEIVPFYLYEAEVDVYPYATYDYVPEFHSTKDGVYKITTNLSIRVYSQDFDEALAAAEDIRAALLEGMNSASFRTVLFSTSKECVEGIWNVQYVYNITQLS